MYSDFETTTYGKWILAGEHAVVRGHGALVFPIPEKKLRLEYKSSTSPLTMHCSGERGAEMKDLFYLVLQQGMKLVEKPVELFKGAFSLNNSIPVGMGMGASAALCVALSRWFIAQQMVEAKEGNNFAKELEHLFHGKSSGLDVIGVAATTGIYFKNGMYQPIEQKIKPKWFLSSSNTTGMTSHCIQQVENLWQRDATHGQNIDRQMSEAVAECRFALALEGEDALSKLSQAITKAAHCFFQWGLVSEPVQQHMAYLLDAGALAVKPSGSGGGGIILSLWRSDPPSNLNLIAV